MKPFTKNEAIGVGVILLTVIVITYLNLLVAVRRARDAQRRSAMSAISNALNEYQENFGFFPPSVDGKIKACKGEKFNENVSEIKELERFDQNLFFEGLRTCEWGVDSLSDLGMFEEDEEVYLTQIPEDPKVSEGINFIYLSNTKRYQIYAYLEGEDDEEGYDLGIVGRILTCGNKTCSYGKSFAITPLDRSIEKYEQELIELQKTSNPKP